MQSPRNKSRFPSRFSEEYRPGRRRHGPGGLDGPARPCRREQHDPSGPDRLRRPRHRRGGRCLVGQERSRQAGGHGRRLPGSPRRQLWLHQAAVRRSGRRARGPPVRRLRRLPEGDGLPEAGRRRDLRHAAGLPLGAFRLRHPEGAERLHGEAADGRRPDVPQDVQAGRRGDGEEPQGGRGIDVPAQPRARSNWPSASTTAKSATSSSCAATACTARADRCSRRRSRPASSEVDYQIRRSTASSGPAAAASATSTSTSSTIAAG